MTRWRPILFLLAALAAAQPALAKDKAFVRYRVAQEDPTTPSPHATTTISFFSVVSREGLTRYWIAQQRYKATWGGRDKPVLWVDGRSCPGLNGAIADLANLSIVDEDAPPRTAPPPASAGRITFTGPITPRMPGTLSVSDDRGPLFAWWELAQTQLAACWRPARVEVNGKLYTP